MLDHHGGFSTGLILQETGLKPASLVNVSV